MLASMRMVGIDGIDAYPVEVEVDAARGMPHVVVVRLPDLRERRRPRA